MYRLILCSLAVLAGCGAKTDSSTSASVAEVAKLPKAYNVPSGSIADALAGEHRTDKERARDADRHPAQTLAFFEMKPTDHVIEIWPGRGWYTKILAPVVRGQGKLTLGLTDPEAEGFRGSLARDTIKDLAAHPELYSEVEHVVFSPPNKLSLGPPASADLVLTFRNTHNWAQQEGWKTVKKNFEAVHEVLKPDGRLGIVQHRDVPKYVRYKFTSTPAPASHLMGLLAQLPAVEDGNVVDGKRGYLPEAWVTELLREVGFSCKASNINANPKDTKDHPNNVWSLPPTFREGDTDRAKYAAIGESDRMTLLCTKSAKMTAAN